MTRTILLTLLLLAAFAPRALADGAKCEALAAATLTVDGSTVTIESATLVPATASIPEHCDVRGTIRPEAKFAVKLPTNWNSRFYMVGGGGFAGTISFGPMNTGLQKGYATASTDTGHDAQKEPLGTFGRRTPDNPNAERKILDYAYLAVHNTAVVAKQLIKAFYGSEPRYSYWVGCSTGGRQGLMEAQRYPTDFDGYVIGAPVLKISHEGMRGIWNAHAVADGPGKIAVSKLPLLADVIYKKCDATDGLADGVIEDPRRCNFDPAADLKKCAGDADGADCFTTAQIAGLKKVYGGVRNAAGKLFYPGQPVGAEVVAAGPNGQGRSGWVGSIGAEPGAGLSFGETFMRFIAFNPPRGAEWSYKAFDFDADPPKLAAISAVIDATNPDLSAAKKRGAKIIHYHGWADALVNPQISVEYFESVRKKMGEKETREFYRFYMVPGMFHCAGGVGCDRADWFAPLVEWVEKGTAPGTLAAARVEKGETVRTRPLCAYPQIAKYTGKGDGSKAENFTCVTPAEKSK